mgnify:CR=1 FL=1
MHSRPGPRFARFDSSRYPGAQTHLKSSAMATHVACSEQSLSSHGSQRVTLFAYAGSPKSFRFSKMPPAMVFRLTWAELKCISRDSDLNFDNPSPPRFWFLSKFEFLTYVFDCWPNCRSTDSDFWRKFRFCLPNFDFCPKFRFFTEFPFLTYILTFDQKFYFWPKIRFLAKFLFLT